MAIKKVESSMVYAVDYNRETQELEIVFRRTGVFRYTGVPYSTYQQMMKSDSIGSYVKSCIIGFFPEHRLD
jgi:hypothetical protein